MTLTWRKSSFSEGSQGNCVEVALASASVAVRDSKNAGGPMLIIDEAGWRALTARLAR